MYVPDRDGIDKMLQLVCYDEAPPPRRFTKLVHCIWDLPVTHPLVCAVS
jgi:hypothetical protein